MKSKSFLLLVVAMAVTAFSFAQGFHIGVKGGASLYKIEGRSFDQQFNYGYNAGLFTEINFGRHLGIQPEVMWNQAQTRTTSDFQSVYHVSARDLTNVKLNYLTIPVLASYRPAKFISFQAGPQFGILINKNQNMLQNGRNAFRQGDLSLLAGVQLNIRGLKLGGRYSIGVTNINNLDNQDTWKNHGFQLYAGFRII